MKKQFRGLVLEPTFLEKTGHRSATVPWQLAFELNRPTTDVEFLVENQLVTLAPDRWYDMCISL